MGPRADFTCLSPKCRQDGAATVYADLPVESKRCPVCGSKRFQRLYNHAPGMIRSGGRHLQHVIDGAGADAQLVKSDRTASRLQAEKRGAPTLAVPISQVAGMLGGLAAGKSAPVPHVSHPVMARVTGQAPIPGQGSMRDTQYRIANGKVAAS